MGRPTRCCEGRGNGCHRELGHAGACEDQYGNRLADCCQVNAECRCWSGAEITRRVRAEPDGMDHSALEILLDGKWVSLAYGTNAESGEQAILLKRLICTAVSDAYADAAKIAGLIGGDEDIPNAEDVQRIADELVAKSVEARRG